MNGPVLAILLTVFVHIVGAIVLIWAMAGPDVVRIFRTDGDGGDGGLPRDPGAPPEPEPTPGLGVPLDDADPSAVRLRESGRIAPGYPQRPRRPAHAPAPAPARERETA